MLNSKMLSCHCISSACVVIVVLQIIRRVIPWLYTNLIGPKMFGPMVDVRKMGEWALITGATDGIGKSYAKSLAKRGLNLVLVSRSLDKLEAVAKEINAIYPNVQIKVVQADFTDGPHIFDHIKKNIEGLEIGTLINNVGMSYDHPDYFLEISPEEIKNIVTCNIISVTHMCHLVIPAMIARKKGVVVNISSLSARVPAPLLTVYAATKAFVDKFTVDLDVEYRSKGLTIQAVLPGFVSTKMSKIRKASLMSPSSDDFAESALNTLGVTNFTTGYFPHSIMRLVIETLKALATDKVAENLTLKTMNQMRAKSIRKKTK